MADEREHDITKDLDAARKPTKFYLEVVPMKDFVILSAVLAIALAAGALLLSVGVKRA